MAEQPSGAVTFLFTDIEGSTRLVKQLREQYGVVLQDHQRLLRAAFEAHGRGRRLAPVLGRSPTKPEALLF
jgi:class 3 adenylate cyclase